MRSGAVSAPLLDFSYKSLNLTSSVADKKHFTLYMAVEIICTISCLLDVVFRRAASLFPAYESSTILFCCINVKVNIPQNEKLRHQLEPSVLVSVWEFACDFMPTEKYRKEIKFSKPQLFLLLLYNTYCFFKWQFLLSTSIRRLFETGIDWTWFIYLSNY